MWAHAPYAPSPDATVFLSALAEDCGRTGPFVRSVHVYTAANPPPDDAAPAAGAPRPRASVYSAGGDDDPVGTATDTPWPWAFVRPNGRDAEPA